MRNRKKWIVLLFGVIGVGLLVYSLWHIGDAFAVYREGNRVYEQLKESAEREEKTNIPIDFVGLRRINAQVVGWIRLEGTIIDYPVVQGTDNIYYLDHLFDHSENWMGSVFVDCRVRSNLESSLTPVYAHHTNNGAMFYLVESYKEQEFYDAHPVWTYYTRTQAFELIPFAGLVVDSGTSFLRLTFEDEEDFQSYIKSFCDRSTFLPQEDYNGEERIVMLCTCTDDFADARYILLCKVRKTDS